MMRTFVIFVALLVTPAYAQVGGRVVGVKVDPTGASCSEGDPVKVYLGLTYYCNGTIYASPSFALDSDLTGHASSNATHGVSGVILGSNNTQTLSNKSHSDNVSWFVDSSDSSKRLRMEVSGITTATTRVATWQDHDGTVAFLECNGSNSHGMTLWGVTTGTDPSFDTGTEVCAAHGCTCVTTFDTLGTPISCATAHTSYDGWLAQCK